MGFITAEINYQPKTGETAFIRWKHENNKNLSWHGHGQTKRRNEFKTSKKGVLRVRI
jgi:hypothetical protein